MGYSSRGRRHYMLDIVSSFLRAHVVLTLLFVKLALLLGSGVLVLLVLGDKIVHVTLSLGELHLVHSFSSVPVQESLTAEHGSEVLGHALEHLLNGSTVTGESDRHFETLWRNVADAGLDVVRNPLDEVGGVLVLHVEHLLVSLLGGHTATEKRGSSEVATVARISGAHHILGIEHLLRQLRHREGAVLLGATGGQRSEAGHEEVETRERNKVHSNFAQVTIQLTREAQAASDAADGRAHEVVQVAVGWCGELQRAETDVIQSFIVQEEALIGVLDELVEGQHSVVWLDDGVAHLRRRNHGKGLHDAIWILLTYLGDKECTHTSTSATAQAVRHLES